MSKNPVNLFLSSKIIALDGPLIEISSLNDFYFLGYNEKVAEIYTFSVFFAFLMSVFHSNLLRIEISKSDFLKVQ